MISTALLAASLAGVAKLLAPVLPPFLIVFFADNIGWSLGTYTPRFWNATDGSLVID